MVRGEGSPVSLLRFYGDAVLQQHHLTRRPDSGGLESSPHLYRVALPRDRALHNPVGNFAVSFNQFALRPRWRTSSKASEWTLPGRSGEDGAYASNVSNVGAGINPAPATILGNTPAFTIRTIGL